MADDLSIVKSEPLPDLSIVHSEPEGSAAHRFFAPAMAVGHELFKGVDSKNPLSFDSLKAFGSNVVESVKNLPQAQQRERDAMHESWNSGNHMDAVAHGIAALTPVFGPMAQDAAEKWNSGDHAGALGTFALMGAGELAGPAADLAGKGIEATTRAVPAAVRAAAPDLARAGVKVAAGAAIDAFPGHLTKGLAAVSGGIHSFPDLIEAGKKGFAAAKEAAKEPAKPTPQAPVNPATQRVQEAFDPNTARIAPPTTAPGNAVYEHGPVEMPKPDAVAPGVSMGQGTYWGNGPQISGAGAVKPIDTSNVGPRATYGTEQTPEIPQRVGVQPLETPPTGPSEQATASPRAETTSPSTPAENDASRAAQTSGKPFLVQPHPVTAAVARNPRALELAKQLKAELGTTETAPESTGTKVEAEGHKMLSQKERAVKLAEAMFNGGENGITPDLAERFDQSHWNKLGEAVDVKEPSAYTQKRAIMHLKALEEAHSIAK